MPGLPAEQGAQAGQRWVSCLTYGRVEPYSGPTREVRPDSTLSVLNPFLRRAGQPRRPDCGRFPDFRFPVAPFSDC